MIPGSKGHMFLLLSCRRNFFFIVTYSKKEKKKGDCIWIINGIMEIVTVIVIPVAQ